MPSSPPLSRNTLQGESFEENETEYILSLPSYYAEILQELEPGAFAKMVKVPQQIFWQLNNVYRLPKPALEEAQRIRRFINIHKRLVIISLNRNLREHFSTELDSCTALEYIYDFEKEDKTYYGKVFNTAKYYQQPQSIQQLISSLSLIAKQLPYGSHLKDVFISYVPPYSGKDFYLPKLLAHGVAGEINSVPGKMKCHILDSWLNIEKPEFKNMPIDEKFAKWQELYAGQISLKIDQPQWLPTIVIEDNYQSGTTLWSYAKYLKSQGCPEVHGLCCVKLMRDTDNQ